jgi:hypothetical protein
MGLKTVLRFEESVDSQRAPVNRRLIRWVFDAPHACMHPDPVISLGNGVTNAGKGATGTRMKAGSAQPCATRQRSNRRSGQVGCKQSADEVSAHGPAASVTPGVLFGPGQPRGAVSGWPGEQRHMKRAI